MCQNAIIHCDSCSIFSSAVTLLLCRAHGLLHLESMIACHIIYMLGNHVDWFKIIRVRSVLLVILSMSLLLVVVEVVVSGVVVFSYYFNNITLTNNTFVICCIWIVLLFWRNIPFNYIIYRYLPNTKEKHQSWHGNHKYNLL